MGKYGKNQGFSVDFENLGQQTKFLCSKICTNTLLRNNIPVHVIKENRLAKHQTGP